MPSTTTTIEGLINKHGKNLSYVTEEPLAATSDEFINQLDTAVTRFRDAWIPGHELLETAVGLLRDSQQHDCSEEDRAALLRRAAQHLRPAVSDMTDEYDA